MAFQFEVKNAVLQWVYVDRISTISEKYGCEAIVEYTQEIQEHLKAINNEFKMIHGDAKPSSTGYYLIDSNNFDVKVNKFAVDKLDRNKKYIAFKSSQRPGNEERFPIKIFDSAANRILPIPPVGSGTTANVLMSTYVYTYGAAKKGVSLNLHYLQIIDMVDMGGASSAEPEKVDGGYVSPSAPAPAPIPSAAPNELPTTPNIQPTPSIDAYEIDITDDEIPF